MLTDRQNKFYERIISLLSKDSSSQVTQPEERRYLEKAKEDILEGQDFKKTINFLILVFQNLEEKKKVALSPEVKQLLDDLFDTYGNPKLETDFRSYVETLPETDWRNSNEEYVFIHSWHKRDKVNKGGRRSMRANLNDFISIMIVLIVLISVLFTPIISWLKSHLSPVMFWIVVGVASLAFLIWLIKSGNLNKDRS